MRTIIDHIYIAIDTKKGQEFLKDFNKMYANGVIGGQVLHDYQIARSGKGGNLYYYV